MVNGKLTNRPTRHKRTRTYTVLARRTYLPLRRPYAAIDIIMVVYVVHSGIKTTDTPDKVMQTLLTNSGDTFGMKVIKPDKTLPIVLQIPITSHKSLVNKKASNVESSVTSIKGACFSVIPLSGKSFNSDDCMIWSFWQRSLDITHKAIHFS